MNTSCDCALIARVREDERAWDRAAERVEAINHNTQAAEDKGFLRGLDTARKFAANHGSCDCAMHFIERIDALKGDRK